MSTYAAVIQFQLPNLSSQAIVLDTIDDVQVGSSANVTSQPTVTGDMISDHMYRQPKTLNLSGSCSLNGSKNIVIDGEGSKLANFERLFEKIQNTGTLCNIYKISADDKNQIRFLQRNNMVLQSIQWTEKINSMDFQLSFREVLTVEVEPYDVDLDDKSLPNVNQPTSQSFTNTLIDWDQITAATVKILERESLISSGFLNFLKSGGAASLIPGAVAGILIAVVIALNTTPPGWVITAIAVAVVSFVVMIANAITTAVNRRKYAIEKFEYYNNAEKDAQEAERFADFISGIRQEFEKINDKIQVYQVSNNEPQEAVISIDDNYYTFTFTENNVNQHYSLVVKDINEVIVGEKSDITSAITDFGKATSSNYIFKTNKATRTYIICPSEDKDDLTNYFVVVCQFNPDDFNKIITEIIESKIFRNAAGGE